MTTGTTDRFGLTTWSSGDDPFGRAQFQQDNLNVEQLGAIFRVGLSASKPTASAAEYQKTFWYSTDTQILEYNNGSAWVTVDSKGLSADVSSLSPGTPANGQGTSTRIARADHSHSVPVGTATTITNTNSAGSATTFARSDHNHAIGTGVVSNDNLAGSIAYGKLVLTNSVVNADVSSTAAIAYSKLNLSGSVVNADVSASAAIAYSKLNLSGSVVDADISTSAAISRTKLSTNIVSASGAIAFSTGSGLSLNVDGTTIEISGNSARVKAASIGRSHLASDVVSATGSISFSSGSGLSVNTDNTTVEVSTNALRLKDAGVSRAKLNSDVVSSTGAVLLSGTGLAVNTDNTTVELSSNAIRVKAASIGKAQLGTDIVSATGALTFSNATGLAANTDNATVEISASNTIRVKAASIGKAQLATDVVSSTGALSFSNGAGLSAVANPNGAGTGVASIAVGSAGLSVNGGISFTSAGAPTSSVNDGNLSVDTTNNLLYFRSGGSWRNALWAAGTSGTGAPTARGVWIGAGTTPTSGQGAVGDIWITY